MIRKIKGTIEGCGKEVCAVETRTDGKLNDEPSIQFCGQFCPYHQEVHYCEKCWNKLKLGGKNENN